MNTLKLLFLLPLLFLTACDPDSLLPGSDELSSGTAFSIRLTDGPIELDEVNIDIQQVFVKGPGGFEEISLGTHAGIYNLLDLQNGIDTVIATGDLQLTQITEIRLVLGPDNTVVADGKTYDLKVPSGSQSGLKIKICLDLTDAPQYDLLLDFDAGASIHQTGNGKFIMKPVIHVMNPDAKCGTSDNDYDDDGEDEEGEEEEDPGSIDVPDDVASWLEANYPGYTYELSISKFCSEEIYKVKATKDAEVIFLYFSLDQSYFQSAVLIANADLPEAVTAAIATDYPDHTIVDNSSTYQINRAGEIWYQVRLQSDSEVLEVVYKEDATFVCSAEGSNDPVDEGEGMEEEEEDMDPIKLIPQAVIDLITEQFPGYIFSSISNGVLCTGTEVYILKGGKGLATLWLYFDLDWNLLQSAQPVPEKDLPEAVLEGIAADYAGYKIMNNKSWKVSGVGGEIWYRVYIKKNQSGQKMYVLYTEAGVFTCEE